MIICSSQCSLVSVTRFGEISPFWQNMLRRWQNFNGLFSIWQKFDAIGQIYIVANGQILKSYQGI